MTIELKQGNPARLFPVLADTSREKRLVSVLLAILPIVPDLARELLSGIAPRIGKTTKVRAYTEVVLKKGDTGRERPDGLLVIETRSRTWTALIEAKAGNSEIDAHQVEKYLEIASLNGIDAIITISNQFVARVDHCPADVTEKARGDVGLFHWSWTYIQTCCALLGLSRAVEDVEQVYILEELETMLSHPKAGVDRFRNMGSGWKDVVQAIATHDSLSNKDPIVQEAVGSWHSEMRDLSLQLSRHVGSPVNERVERKHLGDPTKRLDVDGEALVDDHVLEAGFDIPDAASTMSVRADLARKSIIVGMKLKAPEDRKSLSARINWLLRMLKQDEPGLMVRAYWHGRKKYAQKDVKTLREDPEAIAPDDNKVPSSFEVILVEDLGRRFGGQKTFIEDVEKIVPRFYDVAGQYLRAWQPSPPKPVEQRHAAPASSLSHGGSAQTRCARLFWLGALESIKLISHEKQATALQKARPHLEAVAPDAEVAPIVPFLSGDAPLSKQDIDHAERALQEWLNEIDLEPADVEDHFMGVVAVMAEGEDLSDEQVRNIEARLANDVLAQSTITRAIGDHRRSDSASPQGIQPALSTSLSGWKSARV